MLTTLADEYHRTAIDHQMLNPTLLFPVKYYVAGKIEFQT
jgi:hypothetical protein